MLEDDLLTGVMELLRRGRWLAVHIRRSDRAITQGDRGAPDVWACRPPRMLYAELKRELDQPTPDQDKWLNALRACNGPEVYVWRPSDWRTGAIERVIL